MEIWPIQNPDVNVTWSPSQNKAFTCLLTYVCQKDPRSHCFDSYIADALQKCGEAEWDKALDWRPAGPRFESRCGNLLRNFGNFLYPTLPVSFGRDTKSRRFLLSGVYARGRNRSHQSALECVTVMDSTTLREGQL